MLPHSSTVFATLFPEPGEHVGSGENTPADAARLAHACKHGAGAFTLCSLV